MGTCISRCVSSTEEFNPIQDKVVISQLPLPSLPTIPLSKDLSKNSLSPSFSSSSSPTPTFSTASSTITTTTTTRTATSSSSFTSSSTSSSAISRDRAFSNEFLRSCIKENPQIIQVHQVELSSTKKVSIKHPISTGQSRRFRGNVEPPKQSIPKRTQIQPPKKAHESSTSPVRQRSFRKEAERHKQVSLPKRNSGSRSPLRRFNAGTGSPKVLSNPQDVAPKRQVSCRGLSPSPSQRFNGITGRGLSPSPSQRFNGITGHDRSRNLQGRGVSPSPSRRFDRNDGQFLLVNPQEEKCKRGGATCRGLSPSPGRKFSVDPHRSVSRNPPKEQQFKRGVGFTGNASPLVAAGKENLPQMNSCLKIHPTPQVDQNFVGEILSDHDDSHSLSIEDIDNPLISLDCFIFL